MAQITVKEVHLEVLNLRLNLADLANSVKSTDAMLERFRIEEMRDRLTRLEAKVEHLEDKRLLNANRFWDLAKLILAAVIGGTVTLVVQYLLGRFLK